MGQKSKFDSFYFKKDERIHNSEVLKSYAEKHNGIIETQYYNNMRCPECRRAPLIYVAETSRTRAHLKAPDNNSHHEDCSLKNENATLSQVKYYLKNLGEKKTKDKLKSMLRVLMKESLSPHPSLSFEVKEEKNHALKPQQSKVQTHKVAFRRKKMVFPFDDFEFNVPYLIYGKVKLETKLVGENNILRVSILSPNDSDDKVFTINRFKEYDQVEPSEIYNVAMIVKFVNSKAKNKKGEHYLNAWMINHYAITFEKC